MPDPTDNPATDEVLIAAPDPEDDPHPAGRAAWLFRPIAGRLSLAEYLFGAVLTVFGGGATSMGMQRVDDDTRLSQEQTSTVIAEALEAADYATADELDQLASRVMDLIKADAALRAIVTSHEAIDSHPGALERFHELDTTTAVNLRLVDVYHPRGR